MTRKKIFALLALAAIGLAAPTGAFARGGGGGGGHGGGGGGGFHGGGGGFHGGGGGFHGGGFHGGGFHGGFAGFHRDGFHHEFHRHAFGFGFGPYAYDGYPYYDNYYDDGCYLVRRRVMTSYGWRVRRVQVCT